MHKLKHLVVDGNAVLYKHFFGYKKYPIEDIIAVAHVNMLYKMQWLAAQHKVDNVVVTFDCNNWSWRKLYTSDMNTEKVTHRKYKAGRHEKMTEKEKAKLDEFKASIGRYCDFFKTQTSVLTLQGNYLEGDDLIAGYVQGHPHDDHIIYSTDKDFMQLINSIEGNVTLIESQKDTERTLDDWDNNPHMFLFEKCFRGEARGGDNVQNAYPRLQRKKMMAAYTDEYALTNIMNHKFVVEDLDDDGNLVSYNYRTMDLFKENRLLMGLAYQPPHIRSLIDATIIKAIENIGKFEYMGFLKFCKAHGMDSAIREKDKFMTLLTGSYLKSSSGLSALADGPQGPLES